MAAPVDAMTAASEAMTIGGGAVSTLAPGSSPAGIAVDANDVYWTEVDADAVMKVSK